MDALAPLKKIAAFGLRLLVFPLIVLLGLVMAIHIVVVFAGLSVRKSVLLLRDTLNKRKK